MKVIGTALIGTAITLVTIFILNRLPFTRDLVQAAIK